MTLGVALAILGAAIAIAVAGCGSAIGVCRAGHAANALLSKEPKYFGRLLTLMLLPSSQSIYALVIAFMILVQTGIIGGGVIPISTDTGLAVLLVCLPVAIIGGLSAALQGGVAVTAISMLAKQNKMFGNCIIIISASEVFALFGFLVSMLGVIFIEFVPAVV